MNISKLTIYRNCAQGEELNKIITVLDATFAAAYRKPEKRQACTGFELLTPLIPVQCSTN